MAIEKLSPADIRDAKPGRHGDGGNLWLEVDPSGAKRWVFRYTIRHRGREMGMGNLDTIPAARARENARAARELLRMGTDPIDQSREQKAARAIAAAKALSFAEASDRYYTSHQAKWSAIHARQWRQKMTDYALPKIGGLPVKLVDTDAVLRVIEPHWHDKMPSMAKLRAQIESVLSWAAAGGYRETTNPASWETIRHLLPSLSDTHEVEHLESVDYRMVPKFVAKLRQQEGVLARALELTILCATRSEETLGAKRSEIDLPTRTWIIPGERTKNGKQHRIPMPDRAMEIVRSLDTDDSGFLFASGRASGRLGKNAMVKFLRRMGEEVATVHGFRSSFRVWGAECTGYAHELLEIVLGHAQPDAVVRAYQRGDALEKRRRCMSDWAEFVSTPYVEADNVHPIRAAS